MSGPLIMVHDCLCVLKPVVPAIDETSQDLQLSNIGFYCIQYHLYLYSCNLQLDYPALEGSMTSMSRMLQSHP
jgi:hypothetical protein